MNKLDPFYAQLTALSVQISETERMAESLGLGNSVEKLKDARAMVNSMANKVMTKIEAEHVAGLMNRDQMPRHKECSMSCAQAVEYGVWPQNECYPKCVWLEKHHESAKLHTGGIVPPSSQVPRVLSGGCSGAYDPRLSPSQNMAALQQGSLLDELAATGLQVFVIDENTDFSKLPVPGAGVESQESPQPDQQQEGANDGNPSAPEV
jgi:hypothetical protein